MKHTHTCVYIYICVCVCVCVCVFLRLPEYLSCKESASNGGDKGSIPGWEDPMVEGMATHSSILARKNPMGRGAWSSTIHRITQSWT